MRQIITTALGSFLCVLVLVSCTVNPATGDRQFTAFMSPQQEARVGAQEHEKIMQLFGGVVKDEDVQNYVRQIGQKIVPYTERPEVEYKFYVLDTPIINAFALPGGYVYVTRGLVGLANSEAQLASVVGHEIGHITGRHSAERYSQSVLASLGTAILAAKVESGGALDAARLGSQLYISSYSREQENQADSLGIRYLERAGYDPLAASEFLATLDRHSKLDAKIRGDNDNGGFDFFATHPRTENRVSDARSQALAVKDNGYVGKQAHYKIIDGLIYGDSPRQGFAKGREFIHPELGFRFKVPEGFTIINNPTEVLAVSDNKGIIIFDGAGNDAGVDARTYLTQMWMAGEALRSVEEITINGKRAATAEFNGKVRGRESIIRLVAVRWSPKRYYRFIMAIPTGASDELIRAYQRTTYSLRELTADDIANAKPQRIKIITASPGDSVQSLAARQALDSHSEQWFRILNGLDMFDSVREGEDYKIIVRQ